MGISNKTLGDVKNNRALIESKNWLKIWETLKNPELNEAFIELGYNPLEGLTGIPDNYFLDTKIKSISIPNTITKIGKYAFDGCSMLTSVELPDSVTDIGQYAFKGCENLTTLSLSKNLKNIGDSAFSWCDNLPEVKIPEGVKNIGSFAFGGCYGLENIYLPNSLEKIGNYAFYDCHRIVSVIYSGTKDQWRMISKGEDWKDKHQSLKISCYDGGVYI